jgi:hypothetical protein
MRSRGAHEEAYQPTRRYVDEALGGLCAAYPGVYRRYREPTLPGVA